MFFLVGIVVTFFLATILVSKKGKTEADIILVAWLAVMGVHLTSFYLLITAKNLSFPFLLGLEIPLPLLHGPLLYLYTEAVTNRVVSRKLRLLHFAPYALAYGLLVPFILLPPEQKISVYENKGAGYETVTGTILVAILLSGIVYVALSLRLLAKHKRAIQNQFSYAERINLAWLRYLIYGIAVIWILVMLGDDVAIYSATVVFVLILGYFGIKQVGIFTQQSPFPDQPVAAIEIKTAAVEVPTRPKYQKSSLDEASAKSIRDALSQLMNREKPFTNPELTLADLAEALNIHRNNLSQVINTYEQKSFYDYINLQRIEEFKRVAPLPESQKFTLLGLANNCGFNSKTSFNRNFKNATGLSPTEYLKQANILLE